MTQKAIFLDLDDTLLNRAKEITPGNRKAITRALAAGHKVIICTGRPLSGALHLAESLGLTGDGCYVISFNGGIIYDMYHREIVFEESIPASLLPPVFAEAERRGLHIQTYDQSDLYVEPRCANTAEIKWYCDRIHVTYQVVPSVAEWGQSGVKMLAASLTDREKLEQFRNWVLLQYPEELDAFLSCDQLLEIVPRGINKGAAVVRLCDILKLPVDNSIACGDAANDVTMIQSAGLGVAMANGIDAVKAIADYITERDCDHDGIAEVIERFMLHV